WVVRVVEPGRQDPGLRGGGGEDGEGVGGDYRQGARHPQGGRGRGDRRFVQPGRQDPGLRGGGREAEGGEGGDGQGAGRRPEGRGVGGGGGRGGRTARPWPPRAARTKRSSCGRRPPARSRPPSRGTRAM